MKPLKLCPVAEGILSLRVDRDALLFTGVGFRCITVILIWGGTRIQNPKSENSRVMHELDSAQIHKNLHNDKMESGNVPMVQG